MAVIAWTDSSALVHLAVYSDTGGPGLYCQGTGFGTSVDTPNLAFDSFGNLYLVTVGAGGVMYVTQVDGANCATSLGALVPYSGSTTKITSDTTYVGPALAYLPATSSWWIMWAGTNSAHNINIAEFRPGSGTLASKLTETSHATTTDIGAVYDPSYALNNGADIFTYCGVNNVPYQQYFNASVTDGAETALSGSCNIYTSSAGYVNGGVAADYDPDGWPSITYVYPYKSSLDLYLGSFGAD